MICVSKPSLSATRAIHQINLESEIRWQYQADRMFVFLDSAGEPLEAIEKAVKSEITSQVSQRDYLRVMSDLKVIAGAALNAVKEKSLNQYGLNIISISINSAKLDVAASPDKQEANRINTIDKAATKASDKTMDYLKMKEGKGKEPKE
jgi:hypothetical protein